MPHLTEVLQPDCSEGLNKVPGQPGARSGEVVAAEGRWNEAALRRLHQLADVPLTWTEGSLGFAISKNGIILGRLNRHRRGQPWTVSIKGFERWHEPTRVFKRWHYTPVWAIPTLREAKREIQRLISTTANLVARD